MHRQQKHLSIVSHSCSVPDRTRLSVAQDGLVGSSATNREVQSRTESNRMENLPSPSLLSSSSLEARLIISGVIVPPPSRGDRLGEDTWTVRV